MSSAAPLHAVGRMVLDRTPLATQTLTDEELARLSNLGKNGPRDVSGKIMTHCVPNTREVVAHESRSPAYGGCRRTPAGW